VLPAQPVTFAPASLCSNKTCCKLTLDVLRAMICCIHVQGCSGQGSSSLRAVLAYLSHVAPSALMLRNATHVQHLCAMIACCNAQTRSMLYLQATAQTYRIITPNPSGVYYNVRIQVNQTAGHVGFYCNPSWGGQPQTGSNIAQSGNAVWQTGILTVSECSS